MTKDTTRRVHASAETVGTKYPVARAALLRAVQAKVGDRWLSETVRRALDAEIERHFPGTLRSES